VPPSFIKTSGGERAWERAKGIVSEQYPTLSPSGSSAGSYWALVTSVYKMVCRNKSAKYRCTYRGTGSQIGTEKALKAFAIGKTMSTPRNIAILAASTGGAFLVWWKWIRQRGARHGGAFYTAETFPAATQSSHPGIISGNSSLTFSVWRRTFSTSDGDASGFRIKVGPPGKQVGVRMIDGGMASPMESASNDRLPFAFFQTLPEALEAAGQYAAAYESELNALT
jgi:hypothetical protein